MNYVKVTVGKQIYTEDGMYIVKEINEAGLCYCDEYIFTDDGEPVKQDATAMLTKSDIARILHPRMGRVIVIIER